MANSDPVTEATEHAKIDWTEGEIVATGSGAPNLELPNIAAVRLAAERAAKMDAYRHVLEALRGVQVTVTETGRERLKQPEVRAQVEGVVGGCKVRDTRYYSDGGVDVVIRCPFDEGLATALAPSGPRTSPREDGTETFSGLIVDVSATSARPVLMPTVRTREGAVVLEPRMVSAEALRTYGGAAYVRSLDEATAHPRVGQNPLVVRVSDVHPKRGWMLEPGEGDELGSVNTRFVAEGRIVVVLPESEEP